MVPVTVVTGFLGSGKTTLLGRLAAANAARDVVFLVNEFSSFDVDGALLKIGARDVVSVAGGSIFCRCLFARCLAELRAILARRAGAEPEALVIEASGLSDPRSIDAILGETGLDYRLARTVAVADPGKLPKVLATLPAARAQISAADLVVLNRCDACSEEAIVRAEAAVAEIHPDARRVRTSFCAVDIPLGLPGEPTSRSTGPLAEGRDPEIQTREVALPDSDVDLERLREAFAGAGDELLRAKGFVRHAGSLHHVDWVAGALSARPVPEGAARPGLACIFRSVPSPRTARLLDALER